ncbi:hypothetical protein N6H13_24215 [Paenibacillus sp. CC-CFT742]|uniref:hypothetical protein n=1 Tax=Paenibacillus illinoisensis TaxID=59845 RepID=UPI00203DFC55|nr:MULTISPECIES: hypothetical protein [Paenibacillus]WJH28158.1 hypothetical protein N6H13_24215 [Paenibacillus sp. CC-CFT742]
MKTSMQMFYITEQFTDMQTIEHVEQNNRSVQAIETIAEQHESSGWSNEGYLYVCHAEYA